MGRSIKIYGATIGTSHTGKTGALGKRAKAKAVHVAKHKMRKAKKTGIKYSTFDAALKAAGLK